MNVIGPKELSTLHWSLDPDVSGAPEHSFSDDVIQRAGDDYVLVFTPQKEKDGTPITLNLMRSRFGADPGVSEPCFYNQDWYVREKFADTPLSGGWHLIRKEVLENARARSPQDIEGGLKGESFPTAATAAFVFFASWFQDGSVLWKHDFLWCSDRDHNDDRIYVGRYEDPAGVNKKGFNIHRHLSLRSSYSAAPEIV